MLSVLSKLSEKELRNNKIVPPMNNLQSRFTGINSRQPLKTDSVQFFGNILNEKLVKDILEFKAHLAIIFNLSSAQDLPKVGINRIGLGVNHFVDPGRDSTEEPVALDVLVEECQYNALKNRIPRHFKNYEVQVHKVVDCNVSPF